MMSFFCAVGIDGSKKFCHAVVIFVLACAGVSLLPPPPHAAAISPRPSTTTVNARSARIYPISLVKGPCLGWYRRGPLRVRVFERLVPGARKTCQRAHRPPLR